MTPTPNQLRRAAHWLEMNEGSDGEADDCNAVAEWLYRQADNADLRAMCRDAGVPVAQARAAIARATGEEPCA